MNRISSPADSPYIKESSPSAIPQAIMWKTVSEQCNLACKYCYYSHCQGQLRGGVQRIAPDLLQKVIREMMSAARGNATFLWQGVSRCLQVFHFLSRSYPSKPSMPVPIR